MSALPKFTMRELLDAGVHFGHKTMRWNPRMKQYIFGERHNVHIIDLGQTAPMLFQGLQAINEVVRKNGRVLFVGTKRQASEHVAEAAKACGQYYVNHRWLGGMLTNWNTISASIKTLRNLDMELADKETHRSKKELLKISRQKEKLELSLGGIKDMGGRPDILFIIDTNKESLAVEEANKLGIPIVAVVDSNSDPDGIDYPIPGNDDATRAIKLFCKLVSDTVLAGIEQSLSAAGADLGASANPPKEKLDKKAEPKAKEAKAAKAKDKKPAAKKATEKKDADKKKAEKKPAAKKAEKPAAKKSAEKKAEPKPKAEDKAEDKKKAS